MTDAGLTTSNDINNEMLQIQEYEERRMINSASTPLTIWRKLIKEANPKDTARPL